MDAFSFLANLQYAQEASMVVFHQPEDIVLVWAKRIALLMTILAVFLNLYVLLFRRGRLGEYTTKWLLFLGLCALPVPVLFLSNGIGLEQSKDNSLCANCHVMTPFLQDMKDLKSDTLSARHFKNQFIQNEHCWTCHSDYGIFGTMEAKMAGLHDVYSYLSSSYELPITLRQPYNFSICLGCHARSQLYLEQEFHEGVVEGILDGSYKCTDCHDLAHPEGETRSAD